LEVVVFKNPAERIMVALDVNEISDASAIIEQLKDTGVTFKVGNQLGTYEGWQTVIGLIHRYQSRIFCDTKYKDIPETVKLSARAITRHQPDFFNVMADTTLATLQAAVEGRASAVTDYALSMTPVLLGVTVLTSLSNDDCISIYGAASGEKVVQFASTAAQAGLDGIVCSSQEAALIRANEVTKDLLLVTPGIRPSWAASGDQSRITTPSQAIAAGADYLVIGRPITQPPAEIGSPVEALQKIVDELKEVSV
jgi:orotidine-5'-phosphate decarboxylase